MTSILFLKKKKRRVIGHGTGNSPETMSIIMMDCSLTGAGHTKHETIDC